jgi:ADP-ribose pyrophosphatase YjhB (NUDIX family)
VQDILLDCGGARFQVRAAAIIQHDGQVLLHRAEGDDFWALPGGRVELGEDATTTIVRELNEELGVSIVCGTLQFIVENLYVYAGRNYHEIGWYFAAALPSNSPLLDKTRSHVGNEDGLSLEFSWFDVLTLRDMDLRPAFLKSCDLSVRTVSTHLVAREANWAF